MKIITRANITQGLKEVRKKYTNGKYPIGIVEGKTQDYKSIAIAFNWLDAQGYVDTFAPRYDLKDKISEWSDKHISHFSILVAAHIHPDVEVGEYPMMNLGASSRIPRKERLENIDNNLITKPTK